MILFNRHRLAMRSAPHTVVWTFTDTDLGQDIAEIFSRTPDGVYYLRERVIGAAPDPTLLSYSTYQRGTLCTRPFHLQLPPETSGFYCLMGLFASCARAWNQDPAQLLQDSDARTRIGDHDVRFIKQHARWEGTAFPGSWDAPTVRGLCEALEQSGWLTLATLLRERTLTTSGY
jgi:hypothetical protein